MSSKRIVLVVFATVFVFVECNSFKSVFATRSIVPETLNSFTSDLVKSINNGAQLAIEHCQAVFKWNRWNCPESTFSRKYHHAATKEQAYAKAIMAAGIVHAITRNCSRGYIRGCGCNLKLGDQLPLVSGREIDPTQLNATELKGERVDWSWGGCSDDVDYGDQMAKHFFEQVELSNDPESAIHMHNSRAGREIIKQTMVKRCRCHGVSGSCALQTCWMQVAQFPTIAAILKEKYQDAKVLTEKIEISNSAIAPPITYQLPTSLNNLVYIEASPDYCSANITIGWKGNKGRTCSRTKLKSASVDEKKSCRNVCRSCGLRVRKRKKIIKTRCNCNFKWCCEVKCDTCVETVTEFYCD